MLSESWLKVLSEILMLKKNSRALCSINLFQNLFNILQYLDCALGFNDFSVTIMHLISKVLFSYFDQ